MPAPAQLQCILAGGDDYELCFTAPTHARAKIERTAKRQEILLTRIGTIEGLVGSNDLPAIDWCNNAGPVSFTDTGFDHFHAD